MAISPELKPIAAMLAAVPWGRTVGIEVVELSADRAVCSLPERPEHHNHFGALHAAVIYGLADMAAGAVTVAALGADVLARATPMLARSEVRYTKPSSGMIAAEAVLGCPRDEVLAELEAGRRPEFPVLCTVRNADGAPTAEMIMHFTLVPKKPSSRGE